MINRVSPEQREALADLAHQRWSRWMKYMWSKSTKVFGFVIVPNKEVKRWERQMNTDYRDLPEAEKESDRAEADKVISLLSERG
jgi:hypothetical protein